jgi:hypothetical protein
MAVNLRVRGEMLACPGESRIGCLGLCGAFEELAGQAKDDTAKPLQSQGFRRAASVTFFFEGEFLQGSPAPFWRNFRRAARQQIRLSSALKKTFGKK